MAWCPNCGKELSNDAMKCSSCGAIFGAESAWRPLEHPAPVIEERDKYRTFWRRVGAIFLDGAALAPFAWLDQFIWNHTSQPLILLPWGIFDLLVGPVYEVAFVAAYGQTLGKMACGVRIFDLGGKSVSFKQAVLRHIVPILFVPYFVFLQVQNILSGHLANRAMGEFSSFLTLFLVWIGWVLLEAITMLTNKKRRAIHDFIAGTIVIREGPRMTLLWWLLALLVLGFIVPHLMVERNIVGRT